MRRDRLLIRELVENWARVARRRRLERFATVWHDDGWMMATWFQGPARLHPGQPRGLRAGVSILHFLGGTSADVAGDRAISQTKMTISQRASSRASRRRRLHRALLRLPRAAGGQWGIVLRQPIYEKDRLDPIDPSAKLELDDELLSQFPDGYRHLGYVQTRPALTSSATCPGSWARRSSCSTAAAPPGSPASRCTSR